MLIEITGKLESDLIADAVWWGETTDERARHILIVALRQPEHAAGNPMVAVIKGLQASMAAALPDDDPPAPGALTHEGKREYLMARLDEMLFDDAAPPSGDESVQNDKAIAPCGSPDLDEPTRSGQDVKDMSASAGGNR